MTPLRRILLVDDDDGVVALLSRVCARLWEGKVAMDAVSSLSDMRSILRAGGDVDVVLLDLVLRDSPLHDTVASIREIEKPVIVISGYTDYDTRLRALMAGACGVVQKGEVMGMGVGAVLERCLDAHLIRQIYRIKSHVAA